MLKVAYIHARPFGHTTHQKYANSLNPDSFFYDFKIRWHDKNVSICTKIFSWFACALFFPCKKKYNVFYTDGITYFPIILKKMKLINSKKQKLFSLQGDETLYFLKHNKYSFFSKILIKYTFTNYDALICIGKQQAQLAKEILGNKCPKIYTIFNGIPIRKMQKLLGISPNLNSNKILFVANINTESRAYYKGLDFLLDTFNQVSKKMPDLELHIVGDVNQNVFQKIAKNVSASTIKSIKILGHNSNIEDIYEDYSLYVHLARGEVWGLSIAEAALSGLPILISNETGIKEALINNNHVVDLNVNKAVEYILNYYKLDVSERIQQSKSLRETFIKYTEENAVANFNKIFNQGFKDLTN